MHWAAAAILTVFYGLHLPVMLAVRLSAGGLKIGAALFDGSRALRRAKKPRTRGGSGALPKRAALRIGLKLLRRTRMPLFSARGRLGLSEAGRTALACGALRAVCALLARAAEKGSVEILPEFRGPCVEGEIRLVLAARPLDAVAAAGQYVKERIVGRLSGKNTGKKAERRKKHGKTSHSGLNGNQHAEHSGHGGREHRTGGRGHRPGRFHGGAGFPGELRLRGRRR